MAPLALPLSSLLKHKDCLQKANAFCNVLQSLHHRPSASRSWKRSFGAVAHGAGQLVSHQHRSPNYASSVCRSSTASQDMPGRLWSVYNETKKQTEGMDCSMRSMRHCWFFLRCYYSCLQQTCAPTRSADSP